MAVVTYRGKQTSLNGTTWDVPNDILLNGTATNWIENTAAEQEKQRLTQQTETTRTRKRRSDEITQLTALVGELSGRLADLEQQLETDPPDMATAALAASQTAAAIDRHHRLSQESLALQEEIEEPLLQANKLAAESSDFLSRAAELREQSLQLIRNQQMMINGSFQSFQPVISQLRTDTNSLTTRVGELNAEISASADTVRQATRITDAAVDIARQTAASEISAMRTEFYGVVNTLLQAFGLDRSAALQALNQAEVMGSGGVVLTRQEIAYYASIYSDASDTKAALDGDSTVATVNQYRVSQ